MHPYRRIVQIQARSSQRKGGKYKLFRPAHSYVILRSLRNIKLMSVNLYKRTKKSSIYALYARISLLLQFECYFITIMHDILINGS